VFGPSSKNSGRISSDSADKATLVAVRVKVKGNLLTKSVPQQAGRTESPTSNPARIKWWVVQLLIISLTIAISVIA
jgi:hypothetical protein